MPSEQQGFLRADPISGRSLGALLVQGATAGEIVTGIEEGSEFKRLLKFEPSEGFELRADENATDRYHGAAPDGTATSSPNWRVVRFYKDAAGAIIRVRYRSNITWDGRTAGW